jgi:amidophosphoribosyltransferase
MASESCALDAVGATFIRDIIPGEILEISQDGPKTYAVEKTARRAHCVFEYIYFARPDSNINGFNVGRVRREMGRQLAREFQPRADIVVPVPDSGITAARGFAEASGLLFEEGLMKNRYVGRTFIQPTQQVRDLGVRLKLNPVKEAIAGKRIIVIDDSIVRGTTSCRIVKMLRDAGAAEVYFCLSSPPIIRSCYYGIDTTDDELIAAHKTVKEICRFIGADGLHYLSLKGLLRVFGEKAQDLCVACFSGEYPVNIKDRDQDKFSFHRPVLGVVG